MGRSLEGKVLRGGYHGAWAELAGATFANVTTKMSSSLLVEGKSLCIAYITQNFASEIFDQNGLM